jgi:hypothetical protein
MLGEILEAEIALDKTLFCWVAFCLLKMFLDELSTAVKMRCWSELLTEDLRKSSNCWIFRSSDALLFQWKCILSLRSAVLAR